MKKQSAVERLARELWAAWLGHDVGTSPLPLPAHWKMLARHVLARERRARGRTVGWCLIGDPVSKSRKLAEAYRISPDEQLCRVVLVPRPKRRSK